MNYRGWNCELASFWLTVHREVRVPGEPVVASRLVRMRQEVNSWIGSFSLGR